VFTETTLADWALQKILGLTNGPITPEIEQRIVDYFNLYHNGNFESIEDVAPLLEEATRENQILVEAAALDDTPEQGWTVRVPNGRSIAIPGNVAENLFTNFGFDILGANRLARLMAMGPANALPYEDPVENMLVVAGLMRGLNMQGDLAGEEQADSEALTDEERERRLHEGELAVGRAFPGGLEAIDVASTARVTGHAAGGQNVGPVSRMPTGRTEFGVAYATERFRQGWERYQDVGLAVVFALDGPLAARIAATGGDPEKLTPEDELLTWNIIRRTSGQTAESWLEFAPESPLSFFNQRFGRGGSGGGGGAGRIRPILDRDQVTQELERVMQNLLLISPSDALKEQFYNETQAALDNAAEGQQLDITAKVLAFARGQARYDELYGNKPGGMTEEEYMSQFRSAEQQMLGAERGDVGSLEAGLKTGKYQSTIGSIAGSKQAFENSRFMGRTYEAAEIFQANT